MISVAASEIEGARVVAGDPCRLIESVVVDSRLATPGSLFVALRGSMRDGHDFLLEACARGAAALLCEPGRGHGAAGATVLETGAPLASLAALARAVRRRSSVRVVGIAGCAGKTSTKDALSALCAPHRQTVASPESYNNELGVPLTLCGIDRGTELVVCELGTGAPGELAALCGIAEPDVGVLTNVGPEHLEFFGSIAAATEAEAELIAALPRGAPVVLPFGERRLRRRRRLDLHETTFGFEREADVHPIGWQPGVRVELAVRGRRLSFRAKVRARHQLLNLCAAVAAYATLGLPLDGVGAGAEEIRLSPWRDEERPLAGGGLLVNDAYNANPLSMRAAVVALADRANGRRTVAVLGEMAELGRGARAWHESVGRTIRRVGIDVLVAVGRLARWYCEVAPTPEVHWYPDAVVAARRLPSVVRAGDVVLLKGSRAAGLERLADALP